MPFIEPSISAQSNLRLIIFLAIFISSCPSNLTWGKSLKLSTKPGYHYTPMSLDKISARIGAFGDFDNDLSTDLFLVHSSHNHVLLAKSDPKSSTFTTFSDSLLRIKVDNSDLFLSGVIPGDFNADGRIDVLLIGQKDPKSNSDQYMQLFLGNGTRFFESLPPLKIYGPHPFVFDYHGTTQASILGYNASDKSRLNLWTLDSKTKSFHSKAVEFDIPSANKTTCKLSSPHSAAFVDLDGDCLADVFLTCETSSSTVFQIWTNTGLSEPRYKFAFERTLPSGVGPVTFSDVDGDGAIDMMYPVCYSSSSCTIHTVYNQQMGLCGQPTTDEKCREEQNLCQADPQFQFDIKSSSENKIESILGGESLRIKDSSAIGEPLVPIRPGDFNNDGYPDLLVTTANGKIQILESIPCMASICTAAQLKASRRTFRAANITITLPESGMMALSAIFADFSDDGGLDVIVFVQDSKGNFKTYPFLNAFHHDAFFLNSLVLNGASERANTFIEYSVSYPGSTIKYTVLDPSGKRRATSLAQTPQSAYYALQLPYLVSGLGRTNNYIEDLFIGFTKSTPTASHVATLHGVIPNSQIVVIPSDADPENWKTELFMNPSSSFAAILTVIVVTLLTLAGIIYVLDQYERYEDAEERRKALHVLNFDAL